jgi:hypothetical protein
MHRDIRIGPTTSRLPARVTSGLFVSIQLVAGLVTTPISAVAGPTPTLDIGNRRQVFVDRQFLANAKDVELVVHPPRKTGERTVVPDRPWERGDLGCYSTVLKVGETYHMWYASHPGFCYARSKDGIKWEKPSLGLAEFEGSRDNNIVLGHGAGGIDKLSTEGVVFYDPKAPEDQKFRCATRISDELKDTVVFSSPDGIHFKLTHEKVLTFTHPEGRQHLDSQNIIFWDDRINKYVAYVRRNLYAPGQRNRSVARSESDHLGGFTQVQESPIVLQPDALDIQLGGKPALDYYTSGVTKYPWAQDAYYMFPQAYFHYMPGQFAEFQKECPVNAGPLDTRFAASRDGIAWTRFDRRPWVRLGMRGEFDSANARVFAGLVPSLDGREMYMYYLGCDTLHGWPGTEWKNRPDGRERQRAERNYRLLTAAGLAPTHDTNVISRLVLRRDGFISARAAYTGGEFTTPPLKFSGHELVLNVDTSAAGLLRCELLDEKGGRIEGYRLEDCDMIHTANEIDRVVKWRGKGDLSTLAAKPVLLRVVFRDTDLYAFQFR